MLTSEMEHIIIDKFRAGEIRTVIDERGTRAECDIEGRHYFSGNVGDHTTAIYQLYHAIKKFRPEQKDK